MSSSGSRRCPRSTRSRRSARRSAAERVAFSLDLRDGEPVIAPSALAVAAHAGAPCIGRARARGGAGVGAFIVIDLARVGTGAGLDLPLIARVREAAPGADAAGRRRCSRAGRSRGRLADAGCDGALVATALHDGRLERRRRRAPRAASAQRHAIDGRLAEVLLDFHLDRRQPRAPVARARRAAESVSSFASISTVVFGIGSSAQSRAGKHVARLAVDGDRSRRRRPRRPVTRDALERQQHQVIDLVAQPPHDASSARRSRTRTSFLVRARPRRSRGRGSCGRAALRSGGRRK